MYNQFEGFDNMKRRVNKYLSEVGYCSRREADRLIKKGLVLVILLILLISQLEFFISED